MKSLFRWIGVASFALLAGNALAADHGDGGPNGVQGNAAADINDVYAWSSSADNLALIMTVFPFADDMSAFDTDILYVFNVYQSDAPVLAAVPDANTLTRVICQFASNTDVSCWVGDADYWQGDPTQAGGGTSAEGTQIWAGLVNDPFFFDLNGFETAIGAARAAVPNLTLTASGCPELDGNTVNALQTALAGGVNTFVDFDILALSMEVPKALFNGTGGFFHVYASTHTSS